MTYARRKQGGGISRRDFLRYGGLGLAGVGLLGTAACGGSGGGSGTGGSGSSGLSGSIEVWIMQPGSEELQGLLDGFARDFEEENSGTTVNLQFVPWGNAHDQFVTAIGGGQVPDVAEMGTTWTPEFGALGAFTAQEESDFDADKYVSSLTESGTIDGAVYGLPWYGGARSLIYRADILDELGLEAPGTWDQVAEVGEAIKSETEMFPFGLAGNYRHLFLPMVWQFGGEIATQSDGSWKSQMASSEAVEAFSFYGDLFREREFSPSSALNWDSVELRGAFENGDVAMIVSGGWDVPSILENAPDLEGKLGTALNPEGPGGGRDAFAGGSHLVVFEGSQNKEVANAFARFMLAPERVSEFAGSLGFLPGTVSGIEEASSGQDDMLQPFSEQLLDHSRTYPPSPDWGGFEGSELFVGAMQQVMRGESSAEEALQEVASTMDEAFSES